MKLLALIFLLAAILDVSLAQGNCQVKTPTIDYLNRAQVEEAQQGVVARLWRQDRPCLSANSRRLRNIILHMSQSDVPQWRNAAYTITIWFWNQASQFGNEPNLCAFARLANATLTGTCDDLNPAIDSVVKIFYDGFTDTSRAILSSGCYTVAEETALRTVARIPRDCCADDNNYLGKEIWCRFGSEYPCEFQQAAMKAMCSHNYVDRLLALLTTLSITRPFALTAEALSNPSIIPMYWLTTSYVDDQACCDAFKAELNAVLPLDLNLVRQNIKSPLGCWTAPPLILL